MTGLSGETVSLRPSAAAGEGHRRPADGSAAETAGEADGACEEGGAGEEDEEAALMGALELEIDPKREQFPPWLFGHPRGLFVLAATEVWERFGFYGMRSLLVLYMTQDLLLPGMKASVWGLSLFDRAGDTSSQMPASRIYGMYTSVAYLTPMLGGLLADRYLGRQRTVMIGAALMSLGYFLLGAWPAAFLPTLMIIAFGSGALKPNVSSQIGLMYDPADARRSAAFLIFYCAINLGAFMSPLVSGVLHATLGFRAGFYASSAAVALGLVQYAAGLRHLPPDRLLRDHRGSDTAEHGPARAPRTFGSLVRHHRARLLAIAAVCVLTVGFWGVYEQQGNTLPVYADQEVEMHLGRTRVPTEFVQSINPLFIIGFTPLLSSLWKRQAQRGREPRSLTKMGIGCVVLACCYAWLTACAWLAQLTGTKVGLPQLAISIALATVGELYLAPVGLAFVSETAPEELTAFVMGIWFVASSIGFYVCGALGTLYSSMPSSAFFAMLASIAAANGVAMLLARPLLQRLLLASG